MTRDDFFSGVSLPRNPELMRVFRDLDYVEHLGSGIPRILEVYGRDAFVVSESFVRVVLPFAKPLTKADAVSSVPLPSGSMQFSSNDRLVISAIERDGSVTVKGISAETGFAVRKVERILARLKGLGVVIRDGARKDGSWVVDYDVFRQATGGLSGGLNGGLKYVIESSSDLKSEAESITFLPDDSKASGGLNETEITVLHLLVENPRASYAFVSEKTGLSRYRVEKIMKRLKVDGFVVHVGSVQHGHWEVSEEAKESIK
jgi:predicted HTH transcriptional regulator